jgi:hypothetical protein
MNEPQFPLCRQIIWNQVRETDNNSSLDSSGLTESDLDNSIMNGGDNLQQRSQSPASLNSRLVGRIIYTSNISIFKMLGTVINSKPTWSGLQIVVKTKK